MARRGAPRGSSHAPPGRAGCSGARAANARFLSPWQWVASIDLAENADASANVVVRATDSFPEQAEQVGRRRARGGQCRVGRWSGAAANLPRGCASLRPGGAHSLAQGCAHPFSREVPAASPGCAHPFGREVHGAFLGCAHPFGRAMRAVSPQVCASFSLRPAVSRRLQGWVRLHAGSSSRTANLKVLQLLLVPSF